MTFSYVGTNANNATAVSTGEFSFSDGLSSVSLADVISFSLRQTVSNASGSAVGIFDFTKNDLQSFSLSVTNDQITSAAFQTTFRLQTSSPTNSEFKSQNFVALSATTAKTQYRDHLFPNPPPPTDDTSGPVSFTVVPEPCCAALTAASGIILGIGRRRKGV